MDKNEFEKFIKEKYDSLTEKEFTSLVALTLDKIKHKVSTKELIIKNSEVINWQDDFDKLSYEVLLRVIDTKKISFKQYKLLCSFNKIKWDMEKEKVEYKQF